MTFSSRPRRRRQQRRAGVGGKYLCDNVRSRGERQLAADSVEKLDLKHSADWLCDEQTGFSNSWFSF
jgi:hypothetical protein